MNNKTKPHLPHTEFSILVTYTDLQKVAAIDGRYQNLFSGLKLSEKLTAEEKEGQRAFLSQEWERELYPFFQLWTVKIYEPK
ncbi:hypothetical protein [Pedobacter sp. L105]|uniref:hypothetical protein n=1 Tax=Pedobacter sp. L105 TaxID=1641871 RepID=UPI00131E38BE|nr:hypothetical protein [Pedobacter sp. L105]